ncbi:hypothetical protein YH65_01650 [Sulfurovum lithotrophicum]|uniref:Uncharacterized protein n=1 Tax=Sulfurovum lithotrophicum TaxID=206403 RepID=A0A7U4LZS4_9BACT|nr:hypothetical protein [Sulfurovum lithotrophicum]AKF24243.1 hypothetical protein YH65_01650 [Sulfurovum lithotrophicum]
MTIKKLEELISNAILRKEGFEFEEFVVYIYKIVYGDDFLGVASGGGDDGNDGTNGNILIQVYGPADLKGTNAISKMNEDYTKAKEKWDFSGWHYVVNTKLKDAPAKLVSAVLELKENEKPIEIELIDSSRLIGLIMDAWQNDNSSHLKIYSLLNFDVNIDNFKDFDKISKVIDFIADIDEVKSIDVFVNFGGVQFFQGKDEKIDINIKTEQFKIFFIEIVKNARVTIEEFKDKIGEEYLDEVGEYIKKKYIALLKSMDEEHAIMETYQKIYEKLNNDHNLSIALWIVIGYFFDICDIGKKDNGNG